MKLKIIMAGLILVVALSLLACSTTPKEVAVDISIDDFMSQNHITKQVEVPAGGSLMVTLGSNPTTGFSWQPAIISDTSVLKQEGESEYIPPAEAMPGAGGTEMWTFKALEEGTATVSIEYSQPWEGGEKSAWTFNLTVTVN